MTRILDRVPDSVRDRLDSWEWWMGVAYFAIAVSLVGLYFLNGRTTRAVAKAAKIEAIRKAETLSTYQTCVASIPQLQKISRHVRGVNDLAAVPVQNSQAAIAAAPPGDPLAAARRANLLRLVAARTEIAAVVALPVPTVAQCAARRDELDRSR